MPTPKPLDFKSLKSIRREKTRGANRHRMHKGTSIRRYEPYKWRTATKRHPIIKTKADLARLAKAEERRAKKRAKGA